MDLLDALTVALLIVGTCNLIIGVVCVVIGETQVGIALIPGGGGAVVLALAVRAHRRRTADDGD
ncbi:hypothetical protein [Mycetocola zhadangensis]|uniref:Uncharacterized protein n=1 Tax=Mycetocola zhadangensis TaxID=1164595 RepID=A0A3L7ISY3_9MICO|nr:hypothetical protein [Mycetocola zhadangensis]RLQ81259.1 hypothetical protein D9V28_12850 [Mycetocola zhadangensis]